MRPRHLIVPQETRDIFDAAVAAQTLATVSVQCAGDWRSFKARFLERDPRDRFFVLEYEPGAEAALPPIVAGQYAGISFRHKSRKILLASVIEARGKFVFDDNRTVSAIRLRWPQSLTELQRRAYDRTPIPEGERVLATMWAGGQQARAAAQSAEKNLLAGSVIDLSCGGALIRVQTTTLPAWEDNATLGLDIQLPDGRAPISVDARYRGARHDDQGHIAVATQFVGLELSLDGRVVLQRLSRTIQRYNRMSRPFEPKRTKS
ncbi:MAG: PilZ domain-containing protein [Phycisphaerales bacterium]|nr:PilZ domain-containing protein [Phycisphaerales bacterium]